MVVGFRSWWQKIRQRRVAIAVTIAIIVVAIGLIIAGYWFDVTGFSGYTQVSTIRTLSGPTAGTVTRTETNQPGKTLWDWMQLFVIPAVLAVSGYIINLTISRSEQEATIQRAQSEREATEKRAETEREIALDNQRETFLKEYIDKMSELLLQEGLLGSDPKKEVREIARIRTLTVLNRLDGKRKGNVLQFLTDSELIIGVTPIISLNGANLSGAYLRHAFLGYTPQQEDIDIEGANLSGANLSEADLSGADLVRVYLDRANLTRANLSSARLESADLWRADLTEANLSYADLSEARLSSANLTRANLTHTKLSLGAEWDYGADLSKADLKGVIGITVEELEKEAKSLKGATMPDGSIHP